nr:immunoglobulin heavy chain junction region [Macaca mulatta]MPN69657.1 immunoglobulin heavy chain junction region [Macaca mulatta]MPN69972.1 immunoglobulin heavy chain junction region [Macaca mulatta]MPN71676.1 immunoglobulin heavy chain junction region [Macaca mulatta]MPN71819.1 immunoglobulin heavy chain junction region [Macaca mulatta]
CAGEGRLQFLEWIIDYW